MTALQLLNGILHALYLLGAHHPSFISTCTDGVHHHNDCIMRIVTRHWSITVRPR